MTLKTVTAGAVVCLLAVLLGGYLVRDALQYQFVKSSMARGMVAQARAPGTFELDFCGTGTPRFSAERHQPCLLVIAGEQTLLFDAGQGALWAMEAMQAPWMNLNAIFLSHLHSDHMSGVGEVIQNGWVAGRRRALDVYGPPGTRDLMRGFQQVYAAAVEERKAIFGYGPQDDPGRDLWGSIEEFAVDAAALHTVYPRATEAMVQHAAGADVLVHEAYNRKLMEMAARAVGELGLNIDAQVVDTIASVHTDTLALADIAERAGVKQLVVTHLIPGVPGNVLGESAFGAGMAEVYRGDLTLARDGLRIVVPR